ncbi:MAG: SurA N-terminal domain-containing protein [Bdellovibrionaceae bacterium]|nr:SurA N-terminal domain-containing protein [Pseudobdellovibrionaceae bacterium]
MVHNNRGKDKGNLKDNLSGNSKNHTNFVDPLKDVLHSRDKTKKILGTIIFAVPIILVFVFFGLPKNDLSGGSSAARVNRVFISLKDFSDEEARVQKMQEYYAQMFGQPFTFDPERQKMMRRQAIESLIQRELLSQSADDEGLVVSSVEVLDKIKEIPQFKQDGFFQAPYYFKLLEANNLTPAKFENSIRKEIQSLRAKTLFDSSAKVSILEADKIRELKGTQWNVQFVKLDKEEVSKKAVVVEADVQKALQQDEFNKRAKAYFDANSSQFDVPEKVSAQVIVVNFKPGDENAMKKAEAKIKEIQAKAKTEDFGKLAQTFSEDLGTKSKKGDLGYFSRGEKDPAFEQAAFSLAPGSISEPVKGFANFQLIRVNDKKSAVKAQFEEVKKKIAAELLARDNFDSQIKGMEELLKKNDFTAFSKTVADLNLKWDETGFFNLDSTQIPKLSEKELKSAVFQLSPSKKLGQSFVNLRGVKYVVYLKEVKKDNLAEDKKSLNTLALQKGNQLLEDWVQSVRKEATIETNPLIYQ